MKKYIIASLLALLIATPVFGYTVQSGDTPYGIWGSNWKTELAKYGITDPRKLPVGLDIEDDVLGISLPTVVALFEDSLASRLSSTATSTFTLVRGTDKQLRSLSGRYGFILDEGTASEEFVIATCSGTTCTIVTRGLDVADGQTAVAGNQYEHRRGATVKATDFPQLALITRILNGSESTGSSTFIIGDGVNTNKTLRFDNGNANTPEMVYDATTNQLKFRRSGETSYTEIPLSLRGTYADYASLPATASIGDIAITVDDNKLYTYSGSTWVLAGGSSGAGTVYKTNLLGSESDGGNLTTFSLTAGSWPSSNFLLVYKNGQSQREGASYDYTVTDSDTIELNNAVESDDTIQMFVISVDLYNPAWGVVNASIIPDTDNAYDIGTATSTFKNVYTTGTIYTDSALSWNQTTSTATASKVPVASTTGKLSYDWLTLDVGTSGVVTTTFTYNSAYQNTSGKSQLKTFTFSFSCVASCGASSVSLYMDSSSTPSTLVGYASSPSSVSQGNNYSISVIVPNGYYYKATQSAGSNVTIGTTNIFTQNF